MRLKAIALVVLCALALAPVSASARGKASIVESSAHRQGNDWLVSFSVEGSFTEKMENAILSGIPTTFTYYFVLVRQVSGWADEKLFSWKIRRTIRYDNLQREFTVVLDNAGNKAVVTTFEEAKKAMVTFTDLPVVVADSLSADRRYYLRVKAQLDPVDLPIVLSELLFFMSLWDFETPWVRFDLAEPEPTKP
jgi:Domain of unknown function (DUF4390)